MTHSKKPYNTRLFINGRQSGSNCRYRDWYLSDEEAIRETREFFEGEGYTVEVELQMLPRWEGSPLEPTLIVRCTR